MSHIGFENIVGFNQFSVEFIKTSSILMSTKIRIILIFLYKARLIVEFSEEEQLASIILTTLYTSVDA
jgi:hypothetical protein